MSHPKSIVVDENVVSCCGPLAAIELSEVEAGDVAQIFGALSDPCVCGCCHWSPPKTRCAAARWRSL